FLGRFHVLVILHADFDLGAAGVGAVLVGVAQGIDAAAIFLLIEFLALADLDHAGGAAALAPVVGPIGQPVIFGGGACPAAIDLVHVLPARDAQGRGDDRKAMLMGIKRGALEPHVEAHGAAGTALRLPFQALGPGHPVVGVVIGVDEGDVVL